MHIPSNEDIEKYKLPQARKELRQYCQIARAQVKIIEKMDQEIERLANKLGSKDQQVLLAAENLKNLKSIIFSTSSEKRSSKNSKNGKPQKKKRFIFGRKHQPDLPVNIHNHNFGDRTIIDEETGEKFDEWEGQFEVSEQITVLPFKFTLERHFRQKYKTKSGKILTAPGPLKLRDGNRYSIDFGIDTGISKYEHHHPLERYVKEAKGYGLDVGSHTLFDQLDMIAWYLKIPVYKKLKEEINKSPVKYADETPWKNLGKNKGEKKKGFYLWGIRTNSAVYLKVYDSRSGRAAEDLLKNITGYLVCDGFTAYKSNKNLSLCHCWAHVRRKFIRAEKYAKDEAGIFLDLIGQLYEIERSLKDKPPDEVLKIRQGQSEEIVNMIKIKLLELGGVLPKSTLGKAIHYTLRLWDGLIRFLENPYIALDNNAMERTLRGPVIGRKNHYGSKSLKTAEVASIWYSIIETCKANGVDSRFYIKRALTDILEKRTPPLPWEMSLKNDGF